MLIHELRQALRIFRREPAFAAAAVLTLALGIGANTALFAVVEAVLLRPLPFTRGPTSWCCGIATCERAWPSPTSRSATSWICAPGSGRFESLAGFGGYQSTLFGDGEPVRVQGAVATPDALHALRLRPALGRLLQEATRARAPRRCRSSARSCGARSSDPGSASPDALDSARADAAEWWSACCRPASASRECRRPTSSCRSRCRPPRRRSGGPAGSTAIGRLRPGRTVADAQAELAALSAAVRKRVPAAEPGLALRRAVAARRAGRRHPAAAAAAAWRGRLRAADRVRERRQPAARPRAGPAAGVAGRLALGAGRRRLVTQMLTEGLVPGARRRRRRRRRSPGGRRRCWSRLVPNGPVVPGLEQRRHHPGVLLFSLGASWSRR